MKTFQRYKSIDEISAQCAALGIHLDKTQYEKGSDHIVLSSTCGDKKATVFYSSFNGRFFGTTPEGIEFTSDDERDGTPWFDALLDFFYVPKAGAA